MAGSKLASNRNSATMNVSSLSKGVYIASVVLENNQTTVVKFIK
ncbi:MAG: T9SS type A sorting domain-containing protein [Dysgonamonadaceae bacterium]|nr:T9SS type A sorting domain-containing protein [Dysgonamonadaceae bacterium]